MPDQNKIVIGAARVEFRGVELGYTTEDGVRIIPESTMTEFTPSQSTGIPAAHRNRIRWTVAAAFHELSQENIYLLEDLQAPATGSNPSVLEGIVPAEPTVGALIITAPGPNKSTRVYIMNAIVTNPGEMAFSNAEYAAREVEFLIMADAATDRIYMMYEYPASATVPAVASYEQVTSAGVASALVDGGTGVPVDGSVQALWNTAVRADQLGQERFFLRDVTTGELVPAAVIYGTTTGNYDYTKIKVTPQAALAAATDYELVIAPGVRSFAGAQSVEPFGLTFTTA